MPLLTDLFPGLGQWIEGNREMIQRPGRQRAQTRAETLLGAPAVPGQVTTGADGLTTAIDAMGGVGLMSDPNDFYNQMQYATGLMTTPYYDQAGQTFMNQATSEMLAGPARQAERARLQANWEAEQTDKKKYRMGNGMYENMNQLQAAETGLAKDAESVLAPLREGVGLYNNVQGVIRDKGFHGMNLVDDTIMVKSLAKLILPNEAVMEGDVAAIAQMEGVPAIVKGIARKLGSGMELLPEERQMLYDQLQRLGQQRVGEWQQKRADYIKRAESYSMTPSNVVFTAMDVDPTNYNSMKGTGPGGQQTISKENSDVSPEELQRILTEQSLREEGISPDSPFPIPMQRAGNWFLDLFD